MEKKKPGLQTQAPTYQKDPRISSGIDELLDVGRKFTRLDLGDFGGLQEATDTSPQMTDLFLQNLFAKLDPERDARRKQTIAQLENLNQLTSSTATNRLLQEESDYDKAVLRSTTAFGIADINRALKNRMLLSMYGPKVTQIGLGVAGNEQDQLNKFNLINFENQIAKMKIDNPPGQSTNWMGNIGMGMNLLGGVSDLYDSNMFQNLMNRNKGSQPRSSATNTSLRSGGGTTAGGYYGGSGSGLYDYFDRRYDSNYSFGRR